MRYNAVPFVHFISLAGNPLVYTDYLAVKTAAAVYPNAQISIWADKEIPRSKWGNAINDIGSVHFVMLSPDLITAARPLGSLATQANYFRYNILYEFGGLYLDTDTICVKSIENIPTNGLMIGEETPDGHLNNAVIYAPAAQNEIMKEILNACLAKIRDGSYRQKCALGPYLFTELLSDKSAGITKLSMRFFSFYAWNEWERWFENSRIHPDIYVVHWFGSLSGDMAQKLITPQYIKYSQSLIARCTRKGLSQGT